MKNKPFLFISVILIAFVVITSYTPKVAQAEMMKQEEPVSEIETIPFDKGREIFGDDAITLSDVDSADFFAEDPAKLDGDNQINASQWNYFNAVGINHVPHHSALTWYNGGMGCLGSSYTGSVAKIFSVPVNVPYESTAKVLYYTYWNNIENPGGNITVRLYRRKYNTLETELVDAWNLAKSDQGLQYSTKEVDYFLDTSFWFYWFEFQLPDGAANREFCGFQIAYKTPSVFPLAFPGVMTKP